MKERDSQDVAMRLRVLPYAIIAGGLGLSAGLLMGAGFVKSGLFAAGAFCLVFFGAPFVSQRSADVAASLYAPQGSSTPPLRQYSLAESLVARGKYDEAAEAYELLTEDYPTDPEPPLRMARLQRDKLQKYDAAAAWFKKALAASAIEPATQIAVTRELIELYTHKLHTPGAALPHLARLAEKNPNHPVAEWARNEYREIKQLLQEQHAGG